MKLFDIAKTDGPLSRGIISLGSPQLKKKQKGLTTVEYAVAGALISLAVIAAFGALGDEVIATIEAITNALTTARTG